MSVWSLTISGTDVPTWLRRVLHQADCATILLERCLATAAFKRPRIGREGIETLFG